MNILSIWDDGVSAFRLELNRVVIFASYTLADIYRHAAWMVAVCNQELYWENGKRVSPRVNHD
jgi:hypothetical protein